MLWVGTALTAPRSVRLTVTGTGRVIRPVERAQPAVSLAGLEIHAIKVRDVKTAWQDLPIIIGFVIKRKDRSLATPPFVGTTDVNPMLNPDQQQATPPFVGTTDVNPMLSPDQQQATPPCGFRWGSRICLMTDCACRIRRLSRLGLPPQCEAVLLCPPRGVIPRVQKLSPPPPPLVGA